MYQLEKMTFIRFLLKILKLNFLTYDWFCADGLHIYWWRLGPGLGGTKIFNLRGDRSIKYAFNPLCSRQVSEQMSEQIKTK